MKLLIISQYYYPEQFRINDMCEEWVKRGYEVTVLTGIPNYPKGKFYDGYNLFEKRNEIHNGVEIIRIPIIPRGSNSFMLALNYLSFVISGFFFSKFTRKKFDRVFIYEISPIFQAYPGIWYAKRKKIKSILYVMDIWPESLELASNIKNKKILSIVGKFVDKIYNKCDIILTSSQSFIDLIEKRGQNRNKLIYWPQYAEDFYKPLKLDSSINLEIPQNDKFKMIFAGNIGNAQGLEILIPTCVKLKEKKEEIEIYLVGDGRAKDDLIRSVKEKKLEDYIKFIDKKPAEDIPKYYSLCDMAFLSLRENSLSSKIIPAKLQSYLACGMPIICCIDGESKKIIEHSNTGLCATSGNSDDLASIIIKAKNMTKDELNIMKTNAVNYFENNFKKELLMDKIDKIFNEE